MGELVSVNVVAPELEESLEGLGIDEEALVEAAERAARARMRRGGLKRGENLSGAGEAAAREAEAEAAREIRDRGVAGRSGSR